MNYHLKSKLPNEGAINKCMVKTSANKCKRTETFQRGRGNRRVGVVWASILVENLKENKRNKNRKVRILEVGGT